MLSKLDIMKAYLKEVNEGRLIITERQKQVLQAHVTSGAKVGVTANLLGITHQTTSKSLRSIENKALSLGYNPAIGLTGLLPEGQVLKGVSAHFSIDKETGKARLTNYWSKGKTDNVQELINAVIEGLKDKVPKIKAIAQPKNVERGTVVEYILTDYHIGMFASATETREGDWDLTIAEDTAFRWINKAVQTSPNGEYAVFASLGDFLHFDGLTAITNSGHVLDPSGRFHQVISVGVKVIKHIITTLLAKHNKVYVLLAEGNHDMRSSMWLRTLFSELYSNNDRVHVITDADPYYALQFGNVGLFYHHGHKKPITKDIDKTFAGKFSKIFGDTKYRYGSLGHYHFDYRIESPLMILNQYRTLAQADAYASRGGWLSGKDSKINVYNTNYGKMAELTISAEMC